MSSGLRRERDRRGLDFGYPSGEVVTGEAPGEGTRDGFVVALEGEQALFQLCGAREVVGGEHLPLHDGEVDLDLIEPAGVDRAVDRNDGGVGGLQALDTGWTAVGGPIVQDPEHPPRVAVRGDGHHLVHQTAKRLDPRVLLTAAEQLGPVDVQRREIGPGAPTLIFVLDPHPPPGLVGQTRVPPQACLDARLLVRRQHKLVLTERPALPEPGVQVEDPAGLLGKVRIPREEPTPMLPRANGVFVEPAPHGAVAKRGGQAGAPRLGSQLAGAETGERQAALARCFTGDSLDLNDYLWGESPGSTRARLLLQSGQALLEKAFAPFAHDLPTSVEILGDLVVGPLLGRIQDHLSSLDDVIRQRIGGRPTAELAFLLTAQHDLEGARSWRVALPAPAGYRAGR